VGRDDIDNHRFVAPHQTTTALDDLPTEERVGAAGEAELLVECNAKRAKLVHIEEQVVRRRDTDVRACWKSATLEEAAGRHPGVRRIHVLRDDGTHDTHGPGIAVRRNEPSQPIVVWPLIIIYEDKQIGPGGLRKSAVSCRSDTGSRFGNVADTLIGEWGDLASCCCLGVIVDY